MKKLLFIIGFFVLSISINAQKKIVGDIEITGNLQVGQNIVSNSILESRITTFSDTIDLTDNNKFIYTNSSSANNITVVSNAIKAFIIGTQITIKGIGLGQTTIVAGANVTINSADGALKLRVRYSSATLTKRETNTWDLDGDLTN